MERVFRMERFMPDGSKLPDSNLYLSNQVDADGFAGEKLCVLEHPDCYEVHKKTRHIPILTVQGPQGLLASRVQLEKAAEYITAQLTSGYELLVHCGAGVERSPLTVAWWYVSIGAYPTLEAAYVALVSVRPVVQDRRSWLEPLG